MVCGAMALRSMPRLLCLADQRLHGVGDVLDVQPGAVEGAVERDRGQHLADRLDAALAGRLGRLDDERGCAHADDHPVAAAVERGGSVLDAASVAAAPRGEEARADPGQQDVGGHVVGGHHDDPAAPAGPDPVLGDRHGLGRAGAGGVDLGVRPAGADELGELRVAHRQGAEDEPAVEGEGFDLEQVTQVGDPPVDLGSGGSAPVIRARTASRASSCSRRPRST
jgi:hypothetical protein